MLLLQNITISIDKLSVGFTLRFLNGPINNTVIHTLRVTDLRAVEYENFVGRCDGNSLLDWLLNFSLEFLQDGQQAADILKFLLNAFVFPAIDFPPWWLPIFSILP